MKTYGDALRILAPNSAWIAKDNSFKWMDESDPPTHEEIAQKIAELEYLEEVNEYQRKRQVEYPPYTNYLDGVVKGDQDQIDAYIAACQSVKDKYPKVEIDEAELASRQAKALFDYQLKEYTQAVSRLAQYQVALGREELTELQDGPNQLTDSDGMPIFDSDGSPVYEQIEVVVQTAIEPVEPTIERKVYSDEDPDTEPTVETIENPLITQDNAERGAAQQVVDVTPQAVIDEYNK